MSLSKIPPPQLLGNLFLITVLFAPSYNLLSAQPVRRMMDLSTQELIQCIAREDSSDNKEACHAARVLLLKKPPKDFQSADIESLRALTKPQFYKGEESKIIYFPAHYNLTALTILTHASPKDAYSARMEILRFEQSRKETSSPEHIGVQFQLLEEILTIHKEIVESKEDISREIKALLRNSKIESLFDDLMNEKTIVPPPEFEAYVKFAASQLRTYRSYLERRDSLDRESDYRITKLISILEQTPEAMIAPKEFQPPKAAMSSSGDERASSASAETIRAEEGNAVCLICP